MPAGSLARSSGSTLRANFPVAASASLPCSESSTATAGASGPRDWWGRAPPFSLPSAELEADQGGCRLVAGTGILSTIDGRLGALPRLHDAAGMRRVGLRNGTLSGRFVHYQIRRCRV